MLPVPRHTGSCRTARLPGRVWSVHLSCGEIHHGPAIPHKRPNQFFTNLSNRRFTLVGHTLVMCVAFEWSPRNAGLILGSAVAFLLFAEPDLPRAYAEEIPLRGTIHAEFHEGEERPVPGQAYKVAFVSVDELRLRPVFEDWSPSKPNQAVIRKPDPSFLGLSYSAESGLGYKYSDLTHLKLGLGLWSVRLGISRRLPVPARGAKTQSFW